MQATVAAVNAHALRALRALGMTPLRLREAAPRTPVTAVVQSAAVAVDSVRCLALSPMPDEMAAPELSALYAKITEAVSQLGLQCVRVEDALLDARTRVLVFGAATVPESIDPARVLRADSLRTLHTDRARKRALWDLLQTLAGRA